MVSVLLFLVLVGIPVPKPDRIKVQILRCFVLSQIKPKTNLNNTSLNHILNIALKNYNCLNIY